MTRDNGTGLFSRVAEALRREKRREEEMPCVVEHGGVWRVTAMIDGLRKPAWESSSRGECERMAEVIAGIQTADEEWRPPFSGGPYSKRIGNDLSIEITRPYATLRLLEDGGWKDTGRYEFEVNGWPGAWIIGQRTVSGNAILEKDYTGKGYGALFYDAIEEALGLPIVPHGENGVHGTLMSMAERFWEKRKLARDVPGGDAETAARFAEWKRATAYIEIERRCRGNPVFLVAAAERSCSVVRVPVDETGYEWIAQAWCVSPDGTAFTADGSFVEDEEFGRNLADRGRTVVEWSAGEFARFVEGTLWADLADGNLDGDTEAILARLGLSRHNEVALQPGSGPKP